ncbi:MAG: SufD family Fe-S cluster assembly protein [Hyphomonadaceae bacterium]|nr:SufD family Fe-S cluster assembly protein [Hyphomonadaceae bacterium]
MIQLADLPTRRNEAWKYSDLRAAMDGVPLDAKRSAVTTAHGGVIGALAAQADNVETLSLAAGQSVVRVDRPAKTFAPRLLDAHVAAGATLVRVIVQEASDAVSLDAAHVRIAAGGTFRQFVLAEGGKLARVETHVSVDGEAAKIELNGAYLASTGKHADLTSVIMHNAPGAETRQLIKGVAAKGGRGVFQGKIVVERAAQQTDARQYHHGMLLEAGAEIFAKPELLIHADDVQCAHGNTAGGLDEAAKFYLRSRGVPEKQARAMLIEAFLLGAIPEDLPEAIDAELRERIATWLEAHA